MKTQMVSDLIGRRRGNESPSPALPTSCPTAFTVIELLVVIATMAVLAAMLLPALAGTQSQSKVTACTARFRQWAVSANLYANDNRSWLPSFTPYGGGDLAWNVGTNMCNALYPYGMNVPDYFCPMRPNQWDAANAWGQATLGHPIQGIDELTQYWRQSYPLELTLNDNYWVPRNAGTGTIPFSHRLFPKIFSAGLDKGGQSHQPHLRLAATVARHCGVSCAVCQRFGRFRPGRRVELSLSWFHIRHQHRTEHGAFRQWRVDWGQPRFCRWPRGKSRSITNEGSLSIRTTILVLLNYF